MTTSNSSSSPQTKDGKTLAAILSLGEQIAATLDENDLLARWMAHHLANRLSELEVLEGGDRVAGEREVADLILRVWKRRHGAPFDREPLGTIESVERALSRLDPENQGPFSYFQPFDETPGPSAAEIESNSALKLSVSIDRATADLVRSLTRYAAIVAVEHDAEWASAARAAHPATMRQLTRLLDMDSIDPNTDPQGAELARIARRALELGKLLRKISSM